MRAFVAAGLALGVGLLALAAAGGVARAGATIEPRSKGDTWSQAVTRDGERPIIHSLRTHALELANQPRFRWRVGISWPFAHALDNGMPGPEDRAPMDAVDDAIKARFEQNDEHRIVYFSTGGGIREVVLYGTSEKAAWARVDELRKQFPAVFPGARAKYAYVKEDAGWSAFRALQNVVRGH